MIDEWNDKWSSWHYIYFQQARKRHNAILELNNACQLWRNVHFGDSSEKCFGMRIAIILLAPYLNDVPPLTCYEKTAFLLWKISSFVSCPWPLSDHRPIAVTHTGNNSSRQVLNYETHLKSDLGLGVWTMTIVCGPQLPQGKGVNKRQGKKDFRTPFLHIAQRLPMFENI